jgi:hypothetical protein
VLVIATAFIRSAAYISEQGLHTYIIVFLGFYLNTPAEESGNFCLKSTTVRRESNFNYPLNLDRGCQIFLGGTYQRREEKYQMTPKHTYILEYQTEAEYKNLYRSRPNHCRGRSTCTGSCIQLQVERGQRCSRYLMVICKIK